MSHAFSRSLVTNDLIGSMISGTRSRTSVMSKDAPEERVSVPPTTSTATRRVSIQQKASSIDAVSGPVPTKKRHGQERTTSGRT